MALDSLSAGTFMLGNLSEFPKCNPQSISIPNPFGTEITNIQAVPIANYSLQSTPIHVWTKSEFTGVDFCNVTVDYVHPGQDNTISVTVLLPQAPAWNGRFVGAGGSGWAATQGELVTIPPVDAGFSVASTDGGVSTSQVSSSEWALLSAGNPDITRLDTWANQALHDLAVIGKAVTESYFGKPAGYSYWIGCSQGGRQGNTIAQRYPGDFDGIAALAPASNWAQYFPVAQWPTQLMHEIDFYPQPCEIKAFTAAAVEACDHLDNLTDGVVSRPDLCDFDPFSMIGQSYDCDGVEKEFTTEAANIVHAAWTGIRTSAGASHWYGFGLDADIQSYVANTTCTTTNECTATPFPLAADWLRLWIAADPDLDLSSLTREQFTDLVQLGVKKYDSILSANSPNMQRFRDMGGKMITWHGFADELIPYMGSIDFHDRVRDEDQNVDDYFRLFMAPGTSHCFPGTGHFPSSVLQDLMKWVEKGTAPTQLTAHNVSDLDPVTGKLAGSMNETVGRGRPLCPLPQIQQYVGGDSDLLSSFRCVAMESE
jgi:feruloyl esterase